MNHHILITSAVDQELEHITGTMIRTGQKTIGNRSVIEGNLGNHQVRLIVSGPGLVNTVQAITACIENKKPAMIIQTGCAGAFRESGLHPGDIGIADEEVDIHLGIEPASPYDTVRELPFPVLIKNHSIYKNRYKFDTKLADYAEKTLGRSMEKIGVRVRKGTFVTVATITATDKKAASLFHQYTAIMEAMEGSGAAHLAVLYDIPFLEIRCASNMVGKRERFEWNLPLACRRSNEAVITFLDSWAPGGVV
ncbi:MAG: futalosine hydrolase [Desulfobacteraceae bacterium]|nr:MAG: futalosine hydrolase [Desulfobacteraceae bacterium]